MKKADLDKLAAQFMDNAISAQRGQNIWIDYQGEAAWPLAEACFRRTREIGANIYLNDSGSDRINAFAANASEDEMRAEGQRLFSLMQQMDGYIRICDDANQAEIDLTSQQRELYQKLVKHEMTEHRVNHTNWLVVDAPTTAFAKACGMKKAEFDQFYRDVCLLDYKSTMAEAVKPLHKLMEQGRKVHIKGPETDLTFRIDDIPAETCIGDHNIPDGECFTAPVKDSINGTICFGASKYKGESFDQINLHFENGKAIEAEARNKDSSRNDERTQKLNEILDTDEGARFVGEFAIAFNPLVRQPIGNILFDEKIDGSLHLALGKAYDDVPNGNKSVEHWDMVHIQRPEYGGGEIWIDDRLIRKDGEFVVDELKALNRQPLLKASGFECRPS